MVRPPPAIPARNLPYAVAPPTLATSAAPTGSVFPVGYSALQTVKGLDFAAIALMNPGEEMLRYIQVNFLPRMLFTR